MGRKIKKEVLTTEITKQEVVATIETPVETPIAPTELTIFSDRSFALNGKVFMFENKSKMFIELYKQGNSIGKIATLTSSHYSFVYGVIDKNVGIVRKEGTSKSDTIRSLVDQGLTPGQIAKELNSNYSFVHSVCKKYQTKKLAEAQ